VYTYVYVRSWRGTNWDFSDIVWRDSFSFPGEKTSLRFDAMRGDFRALEWWLSWTLLGEGKAECSLRNEDISAGLMRDICERAELDGGGGGCDKVNWTALLAKMKNVNAHATGDRTPVQWVELEAAVAMTEDERMVLAHAKTVCLRFYDGDCGVSL